jgi:hypothetical protein
VSLAIGCKVIVVDRRSVFVGLIGTVAGWRGRYVLVNLPGYRDHPMQILPTMLARAQR